jgi:hypothetical protein
MEYLTVSESRELRKNFNRNLFRFQKRYEEKEINQTEVDLIQ